MRLSMDGNLGIGMTEPAEKLSVSGNLTATGGLSAAGLMSYFGGKVGISNDSDTFDFQSTDNEAGIHVKSKGDVALILEADTDNSGESDNPKIKLIQDGGAVCGSIHMAGNASSTYRIPANTMVMGSYDDYPVAIVQNGYSQILVDASSNVGIGNCAPNKKLTVTGDISASSCVYGHCQVCSPAICGTTSVCGVNVCGTTSVCGQTLCGTSYVYSPQICGTTTVAGPAVCGTTSVCGPLVCGTTAVCAPLVCGTNCVTASCMIGTGCTIACGSNYYLDNGGYKIQFGQSSSCHELMFYGDMYYCNYTGDVYMQQSAANKDIIFKTCDGSLKETMRIDGSAQKVGIGTTAPAEVLTVAGSISAKNTFKGPQTNYQTLTDAADIAWDMCKGHAATVTLGGNRTLNNPTNLTQGSYILKVVQDGTGSRTLSTFTDYCWPGGVPPTLTTTAGAVDILTFWSDGSKLYGGVQYNLS